ncbi:hypothetical protein V8E51_009014 [Hyaloscypha variabilis]
MALVAVSASLLGLLPLASADYVLNYCSDINTSSMQKNFSIYQTLGLCHDYCVKEYAFAIVEYTYCWCSDYAPGGTNSTCSTPCPGYPSEICGDSTGGLYGYLALNVAPSGTGIPNGASTSTTASSVTVSATPSPTTSDESSSSSSSSSSEGSSPSTSKEEFSATSAAITPIISVFTTIGQVHTITVMPTATGSSQNDLSQKSSGGGLGTGGAVGLTIGLVALIAIISALAWFLLRRKRQQDAELNNVSRRGSTAGLGALGGPIPSRTMSENSRYVLGTDGRQVVETWEPGDGPGSRRSRLMPVDPRLDPFAPVYQRNGENKSRESVNTLRDDHDYSRRVVHQGPILRATNPDHEHE